MLIRRQTYTSRKASLAGYPLKTSGLFRRSVYHGQSAFDYCCFMELTKKIGQRLRAARHAQRLSLAALAARTGSLSKSRISNYEQGIRRMGLEEAQELAAALGTVTATYLLCLDDTSPLSNSEIDLVDLYRRADDRGKQTILKIAESQISYPVFPSSAPREGHSGTG